MFGGINQIKRILKLLILFLFLVFVLMNIYNEHQPCDNSHDRDRSAKSIGFYCWFLSSSKSTKISSIKSSILATRDSAIKKYVIRNTNEAAQQEEILANRSDDIKRTAKYPEVNIEHNIAKPQEQSSEESVRKPTRVVHVDDMIKSLLITEGVTKQTLKVSAKNDELKQTTVVKIDGSSKTTIPTTTSATTTTAASKTTIPTTTEITTPTTKLATKTATEITTPRTKSTEKSTTLSKTTITPTPTPTPTDDPLKCHIPKLDPFHREVTPYIRWNWRKETCKIRQTKSRVENGKLFVNLEEGDENGKGRVQEVRLNYIKRIDDYKNKVKSQLIFRRQNETFDVKEISHDLDDDFVRVDIKHERSTRMRNEYHMYPLRKPNNEAPQFRKYDHSAGTEFNVLMIMLDSVSHACAQRYIPKTYKFLRENPYTTIMKGHTIVGDATTPQLCATFFGDQPSNLRPEGRRGFKGSGPIDAWPSLFKEYNQKGFVTVHSEDEPYVNSFNFRLNGFKEQPTFKYLRPWWRETDDLQRLKRPRSQSCPIDWVFQYTKDFYREYSDELSAVFLTNSVLTHNQPERVQMYDDGFLSFFEHLNKTKRLESTVLVFFGDHGMREGGFRKTTQGKLEERLPFMSITLPPLFHQKYPDEVRNLKRNSEVMTTPYDIHVTLKHLLESFPKVPKPHPYGRSLFTDIVALNRDCQDAAINSFWCVCSKYEPVQNVNDDLIVQQVAKSMVDIINEIILSTSPIAGEKCYNVSLNSISRASKMVKKFHDSKSDAFQTYEVVFMANPCGGLFEATAEYDSKTKQIKVNKNISRINMYGDQPKCIQQQYPYLRKFCCCKG